ncbi:hypothetical protein J437_LFUL009744 [Ladona fulva]|uniref:Uncharacterized protein n=1 Tax=Ladona fulva TaxID=123851 RepID=A0A8K0P0X6_LADFU|nr:hypothetical protein J437_LFUL009744 [Ladona fulva]
MTDNSLAAVLARMTARDGFPFSVFCTSPDLRETLKYSGFDVIPTSLNTIRDLRFGAYQKLSDCQSVHRSIEKLQEYENSSEEDIFSIPTDSASVMAKVGRLIPANHQLCFAHGVKLAVINVVYKSGLVIDVKKNEYNEEKEMEFTEWDNEALSSSDKTNGDDSFEGTKAYKQSETNF